MTRSALGYLQRQYLCVLRRNAAIMAGAVFAAVAAPLALAQGASIVPDGRTQTQLVTRGAITDITTQTVRGSNAFNSFSRFNVDAASTVNLMLPGQTSNLLNLVHGEQSNINGLVNAYRGGAIGGNVFFFNPHGIVVGSTGVLNVGSLTLSTPTTSFMDSLVSPLGVVNDNATSLAVRGLVPINPGGLVLVKGRVNAADAIHLAGDNVTVADTGVLLAGGQARAAFGQLVNVQGIAQGAQVSHEGGVIRIHAQSDIVVAGQVSADGVGAGAAGGNIVVMAQQDARLEASGRVSADAGSSGDGGFVEFSAVRSVDLLGTGLSARGVQGLAGTILIDPEILTMQGSGQDFYSGGTNVILTATNKIVLDDVVVSSRNIANGDRNRTNQGSALSLGDSGNITISAKQIEIKNGAQLRADANNGKAAGNITLTATDDAATPAFGSTESQLASITVSNAVLKGKDISIKASADDKWKFVAQQDNNTLAGSLANIGISALDFIASLRLGANLTYSRANATIGVDNAADINASGSLTLEAKSNADASMKVISTVVGFGYGETNSTAKVNIGNARLTSGGDMTIKSQADSTLSVTVDTVNSGSFTNVASSASKYANFSFAVGLTHQEAETTVGSAATLVAGEKLTLEATGQKSHSVAASGGSFKDGIASAGISVAITDTAFAASLGGTSSAKSVAVKATLKEGSTEVSAAAGTGGSPDLQEAITSAKPVDQILFEKLSDLMAAAPTTDSKSGSSSKLGLSAAFAWAENTNNVKAQVSSGARVTTTGALNVTALANESVSFATSAAVDQRDLDTQLPGDPNAPSDKKKIAISASVAVVNMQHHAQALIGDNAVIQAGGALTVYSEASIDPFWSDWSTLIDKFKTMNWTSPTAWLDLAGAVRDVASDPIHATLWSQTAVESDKLALAGAFDFFTLDNKATSKIGAASINAGSGAAAGAQDVSVIANASHGILNLTGVPEFDPTGLGTNSTSGKGGFGGSYLQFNLSGGSEAVIGKAAQVRADDVVVSAHTSFDQVNVATTVGKAGKVAINGAFSLVNADLHTVAQIGSGGSMQANDVLVQARDDSLIINVGGGVALSQSVGIGFSIAINNIDRDVEAIIGNRANETGSGGSFAASGNVLVDAQSSNTLGAFTVAGAGPGAPDDPSAKGGDGAKTNASDSGKQGKSGVGISAAVAINLVNDTTHAGIADLASVTVSGASANSIQVVADSEGTLADPAVDLARGLTVSAEDRALAIAGAGSLTVALDKSAGLAGAFTWNQLVKDTRATVADAMLTVGSGDLKLDAKNTGALWSISASAAGGEKVGVAGSVSYSNVDNVTEASVEDATVDANGAVRLTAKDDSDIRSVAGAASYGGKAGIGAGVAISTVDSDTTARIDGNSVVADGGLLVKATNDNSIFSVAAALGASQGVAVSGSVTVNIITNRTLATATDADLAAGGSAVSLVADDTSNILSIAGSVALSGGQASVGIAAAYNEIGNETSARAAGGSLSGTSVTLEANETAEIRTYAVGGSGSAKVAVTGSLGINTINNVTTAAASAANITATNGLKIAAKDNSEIQSLTGAASVGGNAAVGASGSYNHIGGAVNATASGGTIRAANMLVDAQRAGTLDVWAISGSGAGTAGISGSIALNDAGGATLAKVNGGADVQASGNVLVTAQADDLIKSRAGAVGLGGTVGGAGAIAFNDIHATTSAEVSGAGTRVTGLGNGTSAEVDNGLLSARNPAVLPSAQPLGTRQLKDNLRGVAVVASSTAMVENIAISAAGGGSAAVAATVSIAMLGGTTSAIVSGGAILNNALGGTEQEARVAAYHHDNTSSGTGGGAIGGDAGVGGAVDTAVASHTITARVEGASLRGVKRVKVDARSTNEIVQAAVAVGGGVYAGLAGTGGVVLINGTTEALVVNADLESAGELAVEASSRTDVDIKAGAVAVSGIAGVGLSAAVTVVEQKTTARVSGTSDLDADGATTIRAQSDFNQNVNAYTAAAAGGVGVAGTVNVIVVKGSTLAEVGAAVEINQDISFVGAAQDVLVSASDRTRVNTRVGSLGIGLGGVGVGAAADVVLVNNGASASVLAGAKIDADRDISVNAGTTRDLNSLSIAFAGGNTAGIAGAVSVVSVGARPDGDARDNTSGSVAKVGQLSSSSATGDQMGNDSGTAASRGRANSARSGIALSSDLNTTPINNTAGATVASGAVLRAGQDVRVGANNRTNTDATAVGAAVSAGVSLGGGIAIAIVRDKTVASLEANTTAGRDVRVTALDDQGDVSLMQTYAGGGGLAGLAASFAWHQKSSTASAALGGQTNAATGAVVVDAGVVHNLEAKGGALGGGLVGIGAALAFVTEAGEASATVKNGARVTAQSLDVYGHTSTTSTADVTAAAGGVVSGAGASADTDDNSRARASMGDNVFVRTLGGLTQVRADIDPVTDSNAKGVAVAAGVGIGVSVADAAVNTLADARTGANLDLEAGAMTVSARTRLRGGDQTAESDAFAAAGGLLAGASASVSQASAQTQTIAELGAANKLVVSGALNVNAGSDTYADASVTGISVGGYLAAGANFAKARTDTTTSSLVGNAPTVTAGTLRVTADGNDKLRAKTVAGAGGLGAVVASKAETEADSVTTARLGGASGGAGSVSAPLVEVSAQQNTNFSSTSDSTSASAVGFSGARAANHVQTDTRAIVGPNLVVNTGDFSAKAWNDIVKPALGSGNYNVDSGSGGILNAAAAKSGSVILNTAQVVVEHDTTVTVAKAGAATGNLNLAAWNEVDASDRVRLDSGGAIAIAKSQSEIKSDKNEAVVRLDAGARLFTDGEANLSARADVQVHTNASSKTYGLAGAAEGETLSRLDVNNRIDIASGAKIEAEGDVYLMAGTNRSTGNNLYANAETRLWNRTAIPIETDPEAHGEVTQHNTVNIASGAQVRSVASVNLQATEGVHRTRGFGEGTDLYREAAAAIGEFFGADTSSLKITGGSTYDNANATGSSNPSSGVTINGTVEAGIRHLQFLTLESDGRVSRQSEGVTFSLENGVQLAVLLQAEIDAINSRKATLTAAASDYRATAADATSAADAAAGLDSDINVLQAQLAGIGNNVLVNFLHVNPVTARTGDVQITGRYLDGSNGVLKAPGDARIDIENKSTRFMTTDSLTIPDAQGGRVTFNGLGVSSTAAINARNQGGKRASNMTVLDADTSPKPVISVKNSNGNDSPTGQPAQLWMQGDVTNLRGLASASSQGTLRVSASIDAETVDIATGGDFIQTYTPGFTHKGGDPISRLGAVPTTNQTNANTVGGVPVPTRSDATASGSLADRSSNSADPGCGVVACGTTIAGNNVYISAEKLNINGLIQAGLPDRGLTIDSGLLAAANPDNGSITNSAAIAAARSAWLAGNRSKQFVDLNNPAPGSSSIRVSYDAANDRLLLDNVRMGGGHMELFGNIFSTGNGQLKVMDGYGRINVNNTTNYDLALGRVDTGAGVEGVIKITDTSRRVAANGTVNASGNGTGGVPLITQITRIGDTIVTTDNATSDGSISRQVSTSTGRTTSFAPTANRRFNWLNGRKTTNTVTDIYVTNSLDIVTTCDFCVADDNPDPTSSTVRTPTTRLQGDWLSTGQSAALADYVFDYTRKTTAVTRIQDTTVRTRTGIYTAKGTDFEVYWGDKVKDTRTIKDQWSVYDYYQHSLNASKAVGITFTGYDSSSLAVTAKGQLLLGDLVRAVSGSTTLTADKGIQSIDDSGRIVANALTLTSTAGAIGSAAKPLNIDLTDAGPGLSDGKVVANALTGVALKEINGDLRAESVQAINGDVMLVADRNLIGTTNGITVRGNNLNLVSLSGGIGTLATPLRVQTQGTTTTLSAAAAGDIHLQQAAGDLRVRQVRSEAGDVRVLVPDGKLLDANTVEQVDEAARQTLLDLWNELALTGGNAVAARERHLATQKLRLLQEYEDYFRMRGLRRNNDGSTTAAAYDPNFSFRTTGTQADLLKAANGWGDSDVAAFEATQTKAYHAAFTRFGGGAYVAGFTPDFIGNEAAALSEGAVWTVSQLSNALAAGLFRPVSDTDVRIEDANIIGRNVTLEAKGGIGMENPTQIVIVKGSNPDSLSDEQKLALLTAERNDFVLVGNEIRIRRKDDVDVTVSGQLKASTLQGDLLLGSESAVLIDSLTAPGEVRIKTGAGLAGVAGRTHVVAASTILEAGSADLGSAATPLLVDLASDGTLTARAGRDLFVTQKAGDMRVVSVFAKGDATLSAPGAIVEAVTDNKLDVRAGNLSLNAGTTIGLPGTDRALDVAIKATGRLDAVGPQGIYLNSTGTSGNLGTITTNGEFSISVAQGGLSVVGNVTAALGIQLGAADDITLAGGSLRSDGPIRLEAGQDGTGDLDIGVPSAGSNAVTSGATVHLSAGGDVLLAGGVQAAGAVQLVAGVDARLTDGLVRSDSTVQVSAQRDVILAGGAVSADGAVVLVAGLGGSGSVDIGARSIAGEAVLSLATVNLAAAGDIRVGGQVKASGKIVAGSGRDVQFAGGQLYSLDQVEVVAGTAGSGSVLGAAQVGIDIRSAGNVSINAPGTIGGSSPLEIQTDGRLVLQGKVIGAEVQPETGGAPLEILVSGIGGGNVENVALKITGAGDVTLPDFKADVALVETSSDNLIVTNGRVGDNATFVTPTFATRIDRLDRSPRDGLDVRAFTLSGDYDLTLTQASAYVNALVIQQNPNLVVTGNPPGNVDNTVAEALRLPILVGDLFPQQFFNPFDPVPLVRLDIKLLDELVQLQDK